ncbi:MAG: LysR family transcriptional regulator [Eubacterium sp.]|nr:LysR family transcriptional regulator [Eubacterium sp.]MCH4046650.1 LysR family transcriptional regulator [Eubacterium sp.]MCH4079746.1 LysR family transcriptional regulator [Eubacterium sp.]MCH4110306.1 LysR family transcriptional regulator [Eubacterium sp.]MCI1307081.1 LysR family transcriptional regulator [Eubacterium sp.]
MTILQVMYFLAAAEYGSMSKAAEELHVSQPALSLQIKNLEAETGCQLLRREPQGVVLTASGRVFQTDALAVKEAWERLEEDQKKLGDAVCSEISIGLDPRVYSQELFDPLVNFFNRHPDTSVSFLTDVGVSMMDLLEEKKLEIAICRTPPEGYLPHPERFYIHPLLTEAQCVLMSDDDPKSLLRNIQVKDLDGCSFISGPEGCLDDTVFQELQYTWGIHVKKVYRAQDIETIMALVRSGAGIALGPESFVRRYGGKAVPLEPEIDIALNLITLKQNKGNSFTRALQKFLDGYIQAREQTKEIDQGKTENNDCIQGLDRV